MFHIMALLKNPLTEQMINAAPRPPLGSRRFTVLRDAEVRGLEVRLYAQSHAWSLEYRSPILKTTARISIPAATLAEAREIAKGWRAVIKQRRDPRLERQEALIAQREEYNRKLPVLKAVRWAQKNGGDVSINPDGSYSLTFK
jgi:Arm DNA-binding domain